MGIPNKISPLTGGDILPRGYLPAEFLVGRGQAAYIDTGVVPNENTGLYWKHHVLTDRNEQGFNSFAANGSANYYIPPLLSSFGTGYAYGGKWNYLTVTKTNILAEGWLNYKNDRTARLKSAVDDITKTLVYTDNGIEFKTVRIGWSSNPTEVWNSRFYKGQITQGDSIIRDFIPCLKGGEVGVYDKISKRFFKNSGSLQFFVGMTVSQARYLCKLPIVESGTLTVSLPWEAQWDTGVQNALSIAVARGWTITVQYRDPEITTKNIPISFLESTGTQNILLPTNWADNHIPEKTEVRCACQYTKADRRQICGFSNSIWFDVDNDGTLGIFGRNVSASPLDKNEVYYRNLFNSSTNRNIIEMTVRGETVQSSDTSASTSDGWRFFAIRLFVNSSPVYYCFMKLWEASVKMDDVEYSIRPVLDPQGVPCFYDKVTKQLFYNSGTGAFIAGFDTVEQAINLAYLPDRTAETDETKKSLTVSLPWEAQLVITGVPAALQIAADRGWTITVQYRDPEVDNAYYNKYAACTTVAEVAAINADYQNDLTADGEWVYPLPELVDGGQLFYEVKNLHIFNMTLPKLKKASQMFGFSGLIKISIIAPLLEDATTLIYSLGNLEEVYFELPVCTNFNYFMPGAGKAKRVIGSFALCKTAAAAFNINRSLEEIDARFPALEGGIRLFDGCQLKKQFALDCLNSIPSYTSGTHNIMLGIHIDYQNDEEVLTAITNAEAKGWTVAVQWNGTATATAASVSTFGLRSPAIYAKLGTVERPDDTTEQILDWGHYVTNWEENEYQEFSSVEEAEEYFNINQTEEL